MCLALVISRGRGPSLGTSLDIVINMKIAWTITLVRGKFMDITLEIKDRALSSSK